MILLRIVIFASESEKNVNVDRNIKIDNDSINNTNALVDHDASLSEIDWINMIKDLKLTGLLEHLANHSVLVNNPDGVTHTLKINQLKKDVYPQTCIDDLTSKIMNHLSLTSKINIIYEDKLDTPMNINQKNNEIDINDRYDKVKDDPDVKKIKRIFNAEVEKGSIKKIIE